MFGFGLYPLGLELSVEASYPVDEAAGTVLIFLSGQIQGAALVLANQAMAQNLTEAAMEVELGQALAKDLVTPPYNQNQTLARPLLQGQKCTTIELTPPGKRRNVDESLSDIMVDLTNYETVGQ